MASQPTTPPATYTPPKYGLLNSLSTIGCPWEGFIKSLILKGVRQGGVGWPAIMLHGQFVVHKILGPVGLLRIEQLRERSETICFQSGKTWELDKLWFPCVLYV